MLHRDTYLNYFQVKKRRDVQGGASDQTSLPLRPGSLGGGSAGPEIAYPPDHLGSLAPKTANTDSSNRMSNNCEVASEKFRGVLYPDLGKSSRKKVSFLKNILTWKKGGTLLPTTPLSNGQKNYEKIYGR